MRYPSPPSLALLAGGFAVVAAFGSLPAAGAAPPSAGCDRPLHEVAIARTERSVVAICVDPKGNYQYRGVRLSDGAELNLPAEHLDGRDFVARHDGVSYQIGTKQLVIIAGDKLIRRENVLEYREPQSYSAEAPPSPG